MKYINSYMLLRHQLNRLKHFKDRTDHFAENYLPAAAEADGKIRMEENRIYIGLNDAETKKQKYDTEKYLEQLKQVCFSFHVPFSIGIDEGGYFHENGEYIEEKTLILTLIDAEKDIVREIAETLCRQFEQESVLITEDVVMGSFITVGRSL
ncbi:MAG: hypothetical protein IKP86_03935 [Anaerolineaceae bacterium]|nr:hypothetical protein [Anaerolineaceae bacterium]